MRTCVLVASICLSAAGCSPTANQIRPIYVAPQQFQSLGCDEIAAEAQRLARSAAMVAGAPPVEAEPGAKVVVWPGLAAAKASDQTMSALGRLKGEFDALVIAASQKNCGIDFQQGGD